MLYTVQNVGGLVISREPTAPPLARMGLLVVGQMGISPGTAITMTPRYVERHFDDLLRAQNERRVKVRFTDHATKRVLNSVVLVSIEELPHRMSVPTDVPAPASVDAHEEQGRGRSDEAPPERERPEDHPETPPPTGAVLDEKPSKEPEAPAVEDPPAPAPKPEPAPAAPEVPSKAKLRGMTVPKLRELAALYSGISYPEDAKRPELIAIAIRFFHGDEEE